MSAMPVFGRKTPVDAALDFKQARPEFAAAISREQEKEADAYATRLLAAKKLLNYLSDVRPS